MGESNGSGGGGGGEFQVIAGRKVKTGKGEI